jgi:molybdopterin-guanine dinucleotide biosynthesis protein A
MHENLTAVILAGGLARRLNGVEKGLQLLNGKPLISHILATLSPQIGAIWLNINRYFADYQQAYPNIPYYADELADFQGALSGMLSAFHQMEDEQILFVPCDTPFLPHNLATRLATALRINNADIAYAHDGERAHPTVAILSRNVVPELQDYLATGERRLWQFFQTQKSVAVDFSDCPQAFQNFNTPAEFAHFQPKLTACHPKILAITGYSGTGKTTLLEKLIPLLCQKGILVGLIKHSHHNIETDKVGKDSYRLRAAGANPTMVVCDQRWALMAETAQAVSFQECFAKFGNSVDLLLVEGFKHEALPKIQLHRKGLNKPLPELDEYTLATATDYFIERDNWLNINNIEQIAEFVGEWLNN